MPSPFPGVDPFIEDQHYWADFHLRFMNYWCEAIADHLPSNYEARLEERIRLVQRSPRKKGIDRRPDIVVERRTTGRTRSDGTLLAVKPTLRPVPVELPIVEEHRQTRIKILHRPDRQLVAVLELLSPDNKRGAGHDAHLEKRSELIWQSPPIHLVELDLLLRGRRLPGEPLPAGDFFYFVWHSERRNHADAYAWTLRDRLPVVPIPIRAPDADCMSDLAEVYRMAFERGRYGETLDYDKPLKLSLPVADLRWAMKLVKARKI